MKLTQRTIIAIFILTLMFGPALVSAQATRADYERAAGLRAKLQPLALNIVDRGGWIGKTSRYWYRKSVAGGNEFWVADAASREKKAAFDHVKLAAALAAASGEKVEALSLPFQTIAFSENEKSLEFATTGFRYACDLVTYECKKLGPVEPRGGRGGGMTMWERGPAPEAASKEAKTSPDGKWEAFIRNYNVCLRDKEKKEETILSRDGSEGDYYTYESLSWSRDSKKIASFRLRRGYHRVIQYVESSPADQLQPKYHTMEYAKPGDAIDIERPVLFLVDTKARVEVDDALFPNPYDLGELVWRKDGRAFTFEYNQRGHQVYRIIEVDGATGKARAVVDEEAKTFFCYSGKEIPLRHRRRERDHLDVGARRLEPPLSLRRRDRRGQEPDHERGVGRPLRRQGRRGEAPGLFPGERHDRRPGSLLHPRVQDQSRRNGPRPADRRRR